MELQNLKDTTEEFQRNLSVPQLPVAQLAQDYKPKLQDMVIIHDLIHTGVAKGRLISKGLFGVFNSPKKRTKIVCSSRQKFVLSSSSFGELMKLKRNFKIK